MHPLTTFIGQWWFTHVNNTDKQVKWWWFTYYPNISVPFFFTTNSSHIIHRFLTACGLRVWLWLRLWLLLGEGRGGVTLSLSSSIRGEREGAPPWRRAGTRCSMVAMSERFTRWYRFFLCHDLGLVFVQIWEGWSFGTEWWIMPRVHGVDGKVRMAGQRFSGASPLIWCCLELAGELTSDSSKRTSRFI
jgi:hypothetical protein